MIVGLVTAKFRVLCLSYFYFSAALVFGDTFFSPRVFFIGKRHSDDSVVCLDLGRSFFSF